MANFQKNGQDVHSQVLTAPPGKVYELGLWGPIDTRTMSELVVSIRPPNSAVSIKRAGMVPGQNVRVWQFTGLPAGRTFVEAKDSGGLVWTSVTIETTAASAELTIDKLRAIMTNATEAQSDRYFQPLVRMMAANQINTGLRMAHFLAQLGHESGDLRFSEEIASGDAYEGRADLGNTQPGDGRRFKGRGLIQLTGRANYTAFGTARQRDFVTVPNNVLLASDPNLAVDVSCWFWATRGLNAMADADNLNGITRRINGGLNGLADRSAHFQRARRLLVH